MPTGGSNTVPVLLVIKHAKTRRKRGNFTISRRIERVPGRPRSRDFIRWRAAKGSNTVPVLLVIKHAKTRQKRGNFTISRRIERVPGRPRSRDFIRWRTAKGSNTVPVLRCAKLPSSQARGAAPVDLGALRACSLFSASAAGYYSPQHTCYARHDHRVSSTTRDCD